MTVVGAALTDGWVVTKRNLIKVKRIPDLLIFSTIQPIMFVVLFAYVFGGSIAIPGVNYREYLMAGIFTQTVAFGAGITAIGLADDLQKGIIDRFRSLPMLRAAGLIGRTTAGRRAAPAYPPASAGGAVVFVVLLLFGYAISWVAAVIGLSVSSVEVAQS